MGPHETPWRTPWRFDIDIDMDDLPTYTPRYTESYVMRDIPFTVTMPIASQPGTIFSYGPYMDVALGKQKEPMRDFHVPDGSIDELLD